MTNQAINLTLPATSLRTRSTCLPARACCNCPTIVAFASWRLLLCTNRFICGRRCCCIQQICRRCNGERARVFKIEEGCGQFRYTSQGCGATVRQVRTRTALVDCGAYLLRHANQLYRPADDLDSRTGDYDTAQTHESSVC